MDKKKSNMYEETKTWNPAVGCLYDCIYCLPSFKQQLKRVSGNPLVTEGFLEYSEKIYNLQNSIGGCKYCYDFVPHYHPERIKKEKLPYKKRVFVFAHGDITFYNQQYVKYVLNFINNNAREGQIFYLQSKNPKCFSNYLPYLDSKYYLLTTIETNRDKNYELISKAPKPSVRYNDFLNLNFHNKVLTIEPIIDFDLEIFRDWIIRLKKDNLKYIWIGYNSKPKQVKLCEPKLKKIKYFIKNLQKENIDIKQKYLKNITL